MARLQHFLVFMVCLLCIGIFTFVVPKLHAQTIDELQQNIVSSTAQIDALKAEIAKLHAQLVTTAQQKQTLQTAIKTLDLTIKKLTTNIALTNIQILRKDFEISKLSSGIATTSSKISISKNEVGNTLSTLNVHDQEPFALLLLGGTSLSGFFDEAAALDALRGDLQKKITDLSQLKSTLQGSKNVAQHKKQELSGLQNDLSQQKQSLAIGRQSQNDLLIQTKNTEATYQKIIAQKKAQESKFEQDLSSFESQLNLKVSKASLPQSGTGSLAWPLAHPVITQYFGNTPFATANPQVYNGHGHNAIDLGASPGTPLKSARTGVVLGTGNTDITCPGASYGKWVFIQHDNGLSTIYAHLSVISVSKGDSVETGSVIGYSGSTGYATGPHLHFGVYASSGSEIASFPSKSCAGKTYTMPVADISAYLNPLSYLSKL